MNWVFQAWDYFLRFLKWKRARDEREQTVEKYGHWAANTTLASRFVQLFERHGVHRNQIPRFFEHGLTVKDVSSDETLIEKLTETVMQDACDLFAVRREWLDGVSDEVYEIHHFYKYPAEFEQFIQRLTGESEEIGRLRGKVIIPSSKNIRSDALFFIEEIIGYLGNEPICRFHLTGTWSYDYWKCRAYLAACVSIACRNGCHVSGSVLDRIELKHITQGVEFIHPLVLRSSGQRWEPEDMAYDPVVFLNDLDKSGHANSKQLALELWLNLVEEGWMDGYVPASVDRFLHELNQQS
jgi:hypothetical protein